MQSKIKIVLFVVPSVALAIAGALFVHSAHRKQLDAACVQNLERLNSAFNAYASNSRGHYPLLSSNPGHVIFEAAGFFPSYMPNLEILSSPFDIHKKPFNSVTDREKSSLIDNRSYWYPGYVFANERSAIDWIDAYKSRIPKGGTIPEVNEVYPEYINIVKEREAQIRNRYPGERLLLASQVHLDEMHACLRLQKGIARFLSTEINNPAMNTSHLDHILPIVIERPELHGSGGHVLYLDGHVEFVPYPGPFPMTKNFIEGLRSLDKLRN